MFGGWSIGGLLEACAAGVRGLADSLDLEQSVRGVDAMREIDLHVPLAQGLRDEGFAVYTEFPYPSIANPDPLPRDRERCDLVIAQPGSPPPLDPVVEARERRQASDSLFAGHLVPSTGTPSEDLFWLEVKCVGQFEVVEGAARASPAYASSLVAAGSDLRKLAQDPRIRFGGLLVVLFAQDASIAEHDLDAALHRWLDRRYPMRAGERCGFPISDRIGNAWCSMSLTPIPVRLD